MLYSPPMTGSPRQQLVQALRAWGLAGLAAGLLDDGNPLAGLAAGLLDDGNPLALLGAQALRFAEPLLPAAAGLDSLAHLLEDPAEAQALADELAGAPAE
jgi:hypothetical protein